MTIAIEIPDDIATHADAGREVLEAFAIEGYRTGKLSKFQARNILAMGRLEFEEFLSARHVHEFAYDSDALDQDVETLRRLRAEGKLAA